MSDLKQHCWSVISKLDGWCEEEKANKLIDLVMHHKPDIIVESGIFGGRSIIAMAMAVRAIEHGRVYGIDPWEVAAAIEGESEKNVEWWSNSVPLEQIYVNFMQNVINLR